MRDLSSVDRAELEADRERLASLPDDVACALPVGRVRRYLDALAAVHPAVSKPSSAQKPTARWDELFAESESSKTTGVLAQRPTPAWEPIGPTAQSRPWTFRRLAHLPSRGTVLLIVFGAALVLGTSAWRDDVAKTVGETVVFALVGARALGLVLAQQVRKRGPDEVDDVAGEPGAVVGFLLIAGTYATASVAVHAGGGLAGIPVSWIGAGLFGLLVTLSLALEYGVIAADRLALK
jgi:hypothetical protein